MIAGGATGARRTSAPILFRPHFAGLAILYLVCGAPVLVMFLPLLLHPAETLAEMAGLLGSGRLWGLWGKTCGIALGTALIATAIGGPLGLLMASTGFRSRTWLRVLLTAPLMLPAHVLAVAWVDILGQQGILNDVAARLGVGPHPFPLYSPAGVILVQALSLYPIPLWALWNAARRLDPAIREAARNLGARGTDRVLLMLPLYAPAAATGALMVFLFSLLGFSVPSLLQVNVFSVEIFTRFNSFGDQREAAMLALPLALTGLATLSAAAWRHGRAARHANRHPDAVAAGHGPSALAWGGVTVTVSTCIVLPLSALVWRSLPPATLPEAWRTGLQEIGCSLLLAGLSATLLIAIAFPLAWRTRGAGRAILWPAALAWLVSGPVFGVGVIQVWNHPGPAGWVYDRFPILAIAVMGRSFLFAWLGCRLALRWLPVESVDAARNLGAPPWRTLWSVALPVLRRPLCAVWACLALLALGEVESTVLVAPPGWVPVSLRIFTLMHYGPAAMVSALALLQALGALALLAAAGFFARDREVYTPVKSGYYRGGGDPS